MDTGTHEATAPSDAAVVENLNAVYSIADESAVAAYLSEHVDLVDILLNIPSKLREYSLEGRLALAHEIYPDSIDDEQLVISIFTHEEPEIAQPKLERFDEEWWLERTAETRVRVCILLRFE